MHSQAAAVGSASAMRTASPTASDMTRWPSRWPPARARRRASASRSNGRSGTSTSSMPAAAATASARKPLGAPSVCTTKARPGSERPVMRRRSMASDRVADRGVHPDRELGAREVAIDRGRDDGHRQSLRQRARALRRPVSADDQQPVEAERLGGLAARDATLRRTQLRPAAGAEPRARLVHVRPCLERRDRLGAPAREAGEAVADAECPTAEPLRPRRRLRRRLRSCQVRRRRL